MATMFAVGLGLLIAYLLGVGPAAWLGSRYPPINDFLTLVYSPVAYAGQTFPRAGDLVAWYVKLWLGLK
jgi:hypothetical protein